MNASRTSLLLCVAALALTATVMSQIAVADSFNWENINGGNWCTSIKDQESTGACWDFATCGALEEKYMLTRNDNSCYIPDISEQQMVCDSARSGGNDSSGYQDDATAYLTNYGVVSEAELPFTYQNTSPNWPLAAGSATRSWKATAYTNHLGTNIATIKNEIKTWGPLVLFIQADNDWYIPTPGTYRGNHSIQIVGWNDDTNAPGNGYWIIKNSWGTGWNTTGPQYINYGYGAVDFASRPASSTDIDGYNGEAYYTGSMGSMTWTGSHSYVWTNTTTTSYRNWTGGSTSWWVSSELSAMFDSTGAYQNISIVGSVIAHQVVVSPGAAYTFNNGSGGSLTVTAGGIQANENVTIGVPVSVGGPQTWTVASGKTLALTSALHTIISPLTINGAGNTIIGGPIDGGGVLNANGAAPGNITMSGSGTLTLTGATTNYPATITVSSGLLNLAPPSGSTATYAGTITGSGALQQNDQGTSVFSTANSSFSGSVAINAGQVTVNALPGLGTAASATLSGGQLNYNVGGAITKAFTINNGGILNQMSGSGTYSGAITCTGSAEIRNSGGGSMVLSNSTAISGNMGGGGLTLNGVSGNTINVNGNINVSNNSGVTFSNGTVVLGGSANSWAVAATITNATLLPTKATSLPSGATVTLNNGTLNLGGYSQSIAGLNSLVPASDLVTSSTAATLTVNPVSDTTYAGQLSGAINLTKSGSARLTLTGNNPLNSSVTTTINGGTLQIGGGTTGSIPGNVTINSGTLAFARSDNVTFAGNISGASGVLDNEGTGILTLTGTDTPGSTTINAGTMQIGGGGTTGSIAGNVSVNNGTLAFYHSNDTTCSANIAGAGGVVKYGASRLTLSGTNNYGGQTVVNGGTLEVAPSAQSSVLSGGGADVRTGKIVFDYTPGADPVATIQGLLSYSCDNGQWDRGQFRDSSAATTGLTLGMYDNTTTDTVTVMATYPGDFNLDGVVDNTDKALWLANAFTGTTWQQGDANGDGVVNGLDLDLWRAHYGLSAPLSGDLPSSSSAMPSTTPEPATLALLAAGLLGLLVYSRRKQK